MSERAPLQRSIGVAGLPCCGRSPVRLAQRTGVPRSPAPPAFKEGAAVRMEGCAAQGRGASRPLVAGVQTIPDSTRSKTQVSISNQNVLAAEAQFRAARAAVRITGARQFPTVTVVAVGDAVPARGAASSSAISVHDSRGCRLSG